MKIVASFFFAAFVTFFVARMICEDQPLSDAGMEVLTWHMQRFPSLQRMHDGLSGCSRQGSKSRLKYHDLHTLENVWRSFIHHDAPHKDGF